ncbi:unnamed protein product [Diatraea saccharalis]|uniref:Uncharacterized protein n=1 Tax=Diatraea saccharalis TaxID=40085 RepID=A0A9N9R734_9NEOP|nr:unnamed protein product [Diatraea saccharalis]
MNSSEVSGSGTEQEYTSGVRLVVLNLPEDEGEGLGFRLTRTLWDPYPWVGQVAGLIRGDGAGRGVSLLVWNCGVNPKDDPEVIAVELRRGRARGAGAARAGGGACWSRLERCALCREPLPAKDSPYARNLVAEQVFEAIATEYEIKNTINKHRETVSAYNSPNRSPNLSPAVSRRGQYQLSMMNRKKTVQFTEKGQSYGSDPNIHRSLKQESVGQSPKTTNNTRASESGNTECQCNTKNRQAQIPQIKIENTETECASISSDCSSSCQNAIQHKLVARLRQVCSLADLQNNPVQSCQLTKSLNNLGDGNVLHKSLENLKNSGNNKKFFIKLAKGFI